MRLDEQPIFRVTRHQRMAQMGYLDDLGNQSDEFGRTRPREG